MEANTPSSHRYTNKASPELLRSHNNSPFTKQPIAGFGEEVMNRLHQQQAHREAHPACAIYRLATAGSQTLKGGVIQQATTGLEIALHNGHRVRVAQVGDCVVYGDGSMAQIVTGAGQSNSNLALVGSQLSNGDEIIDTPQGTGWFVQRDGVPMAEDFLPPFEG